MIEYITGKIAALNPASVTIETSGGVAFLLNITLQTFTQLEGKTHAQLLVHESIREDAWTLYGFISARERELFRALIGVSGVGSATAVIILSALPITELETVISTGDDSRLKRVKGIGQKTAQRIIVDLKDKITMSSEVVSVQMPPQSTEVYEEALAALISLGFQKLPAQKVLKKLFESDPSIKVDVAIKKALAML